MAILDEIFKKRNNPAASFLPVNEQEMQEEANRVPDIPETRASDVEDKQPAEVVNTQQEITPTPNKWGYSDSDVEYLGKLGYTPERLEQIANFDPANGKNYMQHIYESTATKPNALDEKKIKNARLWAGIADGVGMLSQMFSAGKGAHVKERNFDDSSLHRTDIKEKEARDEYKKLSKMYEDGLLQSRLKDYLQTLGDYDSDKKGIQGALAAKGVLEEKARQADDKLRYNYDKLAQDQGNKDKDFELKQGRLGLDTDRLKETTRHNKVMESLGWSRLADQRNRTTAYIKKMGSGSKGGYQMIFESAPNDPNAVMDNQLGTNVRVFEMTKGEIDRFAREARADEEFMKRHPELTVKSKGLLGNDTERLRPNEDIASAWMRDEYLKKYGLDDASQEKAFMDKFYAPLKGGVPTQEETASSDDSLDMDYSEDEGDDEFEEFSIGSIANF